MQNGAKFGAIDIGSNALRFAYTNEKRGLRGSEKIRIPLRLGRDVFRSGRIERLNFEYGSFVFQDLAKLIEHQQVEELTIYATSALRDAENAGDFIREIHQKSGLKIDVIDGNKEAELIRELIEYEFPLKKKNYLLIDIGGGSLELNLYCKGVHDRSLSLDLGTVRMLNSEESYDQALKAVWPQVEDFLGKEADKDIEILGTGGNFRQLMKISKSTGPVETLDRKDVISLSKEMREMPVEKRIVKYKLKPDRARVMVPALYILEFFLKKLKASKLHCCRYGLVQAILLETLRRHQESSLTS